MALTFRRTSAAAIAATAAALMLTPASAFAAGHPASPGHPAKTTAPAPAASPAGHHHATGTKPGGSKPGAAKPGATKPGGTKPNSPKPGAGQSGPVATVTKLATPKLLTSARALTLSAHVSPARKAVGTPAETGTVVFTVDGTASQPVPITANKAAVKVKLPAGKHTVSAHYSGDAAHAASDSGPLAITVS